MNQIFNIDVSNNDVLDSIKLYEMSSFFNFCKYKSNLRNSKSENQFSDKTEDLFFEE